ncbi:MAG: hypothetical protein NTU61_00155 [Candidatus Altiarchaeota archaeon]|nr:hypothetical protein [Candidatus Altiarchaeota archaeon]
MNMLSIVIPALNEAENLKVLVPKLYDTLKGRDIEVLDEGFDLAVGSRFLKGSKVDLPPERLIFTRIANKIAEAAFELNTKDTSSGFRAYRAERVKNAIRNGIKTEYFSCQVEILERIMADGGRIAEVPVRYIKRAKGTSKYDIKPALKDASRLVDIVKKKKLRKLEKMISRKKAGLTHL